MASEDVEGVEYILMSFVTEVRSTKGLPHLVSHIRGLAGFVFVFVLYGLSNGGLVLPEYFKGKKKEPESEWYLFNDFLVMPVSENEVVTINSSWKVRNPGLQAYELFIDVSSRFPQCYFTVGRT